MYIRRSWTLRCLLALLLYANCTICDMILPAFHWNHRNTIFQRRKPGEERSLCRDPAHIYVPYGSEFYFICPNKVMDVAKASSRLKKYLLFENIHMVNEDGFNKCRIDRSDSLLFKCDQSLKVNSLKFELVMFHSMNWNGWSFKANSTYYFINTSNGTMAGLDRTSGGKCHTHNMKLKVTVCPREQKCSQCKGMCCEKPPTTKPPTTTATTTQTTLSTRMTSERRTTRNVKVLKSEPVSASPTTLNTVTEKTTERKHVEPKETKADRSKADAITTHRPRTTSVESDSKQKVPKEAGSNCSFIVRASKSKDSRAMMRDSFDFSAFPFVIGIIVGTMITIMVAVFLRLYKKRYRSDDASAVNSGTKNGISRSKPVHLMPDRSANGKSSEFQRLQSSSSSDSGSMPTNV